jgi:drug/metabolite transporter (DMT)-like permease
VRHRRDETGCLAQLRAIAIVIFFATSLAWACVFGFLLFVNEQISVARAFVIALLANVVIVGVYLFIEHGSLRRALGGFSLGVSGVVLYIAAGEVFSYSGRADLGTLSWAGVIAVPAALAIALVLTTADWRLRKQYQCPNCGYDARGLPQSVCPECGGFVASRTKR